MWELLSVQDSQSHRDMLSIFETPAERNAFFCGCIFPDWGYDGINPDAAEDSHWSPFQEAFFQYLKETLVAPWDAEARKLVAFSLGVQVHGICDELWHFSTDGHACFLDMALKHDGVAHRPCEVACDVFCHLQCRHRRLNGNFWWPDKAIIEVYNRRNIRITLAELVAGFRKLEHQLAKGARLGWLIYAVYRFRFPWTHGHYRKSAHGGIAHGAEKSLAPVQASYARLSKSA